MGNTVSNKIKAAGLKKIGLLGTRFTMEEDFYVTRLQAHGLQVDIPEKQEREIIHRIIYQELVLGKILPTSREAYKAIIERLQKDGARGVVLGCTEIGMLVKQAEYTLPVFDTTQIHALAAVEVALGNKEVSAYLPK